MASNLGLASRHRMVILFVGGMTNAYTECEEGDAASGPLPAARDAPALSLSLFLCRLDPVPWCIITFLLSGDAWETRDWQPLFASLPDCECVIKPPAHNMHFSSVLSERMRKFALNGVHSLSACCNIRARTLYLSGVAPVFLGAREMQRKEDNFVRALFVRWESCSLFTQC